ncbi:DUF2971 domain-containing protein [Bacteroides reticulotermitis]|uniref:DUF2971 domain-containing protein n=1 Tax=Bacteroides reticulotermitis TaxID=1133319 RepID=UPI003A84249E
MELNQENIEQNQLRSSILYKYLDLNGAIMMLYYSNLQFTNATKLNDPFDCHPNLIDFSNVPPAVSKGWPKEVIEQTESHRHQRYREKTWICCLSKLFNSLLMWSYYNGHKGVCVGLNMEKVAGYLNDSNGMLDISSECEVQYRDIIDKPDYFQSPTDIFHYQMCTKGKDWEHEQEVRIFISDPPPWYQSLLPGQNDKDGPIDGKEIRAFLKIGGECFESIYFGVNIKVKDKDKIITLARKLNPDIKIYQMEINPNAFRLDATNYDNNHSKAT